MRCCSTLPPRTPRNLATLQGHVGALGGEAAAKTLRAFISMMLGAMDVPVATACFVEQADVADVVAAEQEPAEQEPVSPARKKAKLLTAAEKRMKPVLWDHHKDFLDANGGDLTVRAEQLAAKIESQYGWPAADGRGRGGLRKATR